MRLIEIGGWHPPLWGSGPRLWGPGDLSHFGELEDNWCCRACFFPNKSATSLVIGSLIPCLRHGADLIMVSHFNQADVSWRDLC